MPSDILFPIGWEHGDEYDGEVYLTDAKGKRLSDDQTIMLMDRMTEVLNGARKPFVSKVPAPVACNCSYYGWGKDIDVNNIFTCKQCGTKYAWRNDPGNYGWFPIPPPAATPPLPTPVVPGPAPAPEHPASHTPDPEP